jgi:hypothetical protein
LLKLYSCAACVFLTAREVHHRKIVPEKYL